MPLKNGWLSLTQEIDCLSKEEVEQLHLTDEYGHQDELVHVRDGLNQKVFDGGNTKYVDRGANEGVEDELEKNDMTNDRNESVPIKNIKRAFSP